MAEGERLTHVGFDESQEELVLITSTLVNLQDYVQHTIGIEVETSCQERTVGKMKKKKKNITAEQMTNTWLMRLFKRGSYTRFYTH